MTALQRARLTINEIDKQMAQLFERRMEAVKMVAEYKKENGIPIDDFAREEEIIEKNLSYISCDEYRSYYSDFLSGVIDISKEMQHRLIDG